MLIGWFAECWSLIARSALTPSSFDMESGVVSIHTLKQRRRDIVRQVPLPPSVLSMLEAAFGVTPAQRDPALASGRLWRFSRTTAWRYVKSVMAAADIMGTPAMPKGLLHGFGVHAFQRGIPVHLVQRWFRHTSFRTAAIYSDVVGPEERAFVARMWDLSS